MPWNIKRWVPGTPERARLQEAANLLTRKSPRGYHYYVDETYFDYGQDWMWTTILAEKHGTHSTGSTWRDSYQALYPTAHEHIILGTEPLEQIVDRILGSDHCPDRREKGTVTAAIRILAQDIERLADLLDPWEHSDYVSDQFGGDISKAEEYLANEIAAGRTEDIAAWLREQANDENNDTRDRERAANLLKRLAAIN